MLLSRYFKLHYWPVVTCVWFIVTFTISYLTSVLSGHIHPLFPYISDTGTMPPESCIFGQMMNIGAALMTICMYIRYRQVEFAISSDDIDLPRRWNNAAFWFGNIICLGISMVGNFQETHLVLVHFIGAFMAFGIGGLYLVIETRISFAFRHIYYKYPEYGVGRNLLNLRIFLTVCYFVLFFVAAICGLIAARQFKGHDFTQWTKEQGGFEFRLASTFSEWFLAVVFLTYTLTSTKEFKSLTFEEIAFKSKCVNLKNNAQEMI